MAPRNPSDSSSTDTGTDPSRATSEPPGARRLRSIAAAAAVIGLSASTVLLAPYVTHRGLCAVGGGCDQVAQSALATVFGVPRAAIGVGAFLAGLAFALLGGARVRRLAPVVGVLAALEGVHLLAVQAFVLHAICPYCVVADVSAIVLGAALAFEALLARRGGFARPLRWPLAGAIAALCALLVPFGATSVFGRPRSESIAPVAAKGDGRLVVREFVDLECPYCRATHVALARAIGDRRDVVIERHQVPLPQHTHAMEAAVAACCAAEQGAEDRFVDTVVRIEAPPDHALCRNVARGLSLDVERWDACCASPRPKTKIDADLALADETKVEGLPTIDCEGERVVGGLDDAAAGSLLARHTH